MSYCRFTNTRQDLRDCQDHIDDDDLSPEERKERKKLIKLCIEIANDYSDGSPVIFNKIYNELARLTIQLSRKQDKRRDNNTLVVA